MGFKVAGTLQSQPLALVATLMPQAGASFTVAVLSLLMELSPISKNLKMLRTITH